MLLARTYSWDNEFDKARQELRKLNVNSTGDRETINTWIDLENWAQNYNEVVRYCDLGLRFSPGDRNYIIKKIEAYTLGGKARQAKSIIYDILSKNPEDNEIITIYNKIQSGGYISENNEEEEFELFVMRMEMADSLYNLARNKAYAGNYSESRINCDEILRIKPDHMAAKSLIGNTYAWEQDYLTANEYYLEVLGEEFNNWDAIMGLINVGLWDDNYEQAMKYSNYGLALYPRDINFLMGKATAFKDNGYMEEARITSDYLLETYPDSTKVKMFMFGLKKPGAWDGFGIDFTYDFFKVPYDRRWTNTAFRGYRTFDIGTLSGGVDYGRLYESSTGIWDGGVQFNLSFYPILSAKDYGYLNVGVSPKYFFPRFKFSAGIFHGFSGTLDGFEASIIYNYLRYKSLENLIVTKGFISLSAGKYFLDNWLGIGVNLAPYPQGIAQGYTVTFKHYFESNDDWITLMAGLGRAPNDPSYFIYDPTSSVNEKLNSGSLTLSIQKRVATNVIFRASGSYIREEYKVASPRNHFTVSAGLVYVF